MSKFFSLIISLISVVGFAQAENDEQAIQGVLNSFHQAAANAQTQRYFALMTDDAVFLGTDATERWNKNDFRDYVEPYFKRGKGWQYTPQKRNITLINNNQTAFFDELLINTSYGLCRGTGILIKTVKGWKISQYNLSVPLPNDIAKGLVQQIKKYQESTYQKTHLNNDPIGNK